MYIKLCFDYHEKIIYIPDRYVNDIKKLSNDFFDWLYQCEDAMRSDRSGHLVFAYDECTFLVFVNGTILKNSQEKAYITNKNKAIKVKSIHF